MSETLTLRPVAELDGQILVDAGTGQLHIRGAAVELRFPMLVVRHGQTDGNLRHVLHGQVDGPENQLNAVGREQARQTAVNLLAELQDYLGRDGLAETARSQQLLVLTSPLGRAKDTALYFIDKFASATGVMLPLHDDDNLQEIDFGAFDGHALEEIDDEEFAAQVRRYRGQQDATIDWLGTGESFLDVVLRAKRLLQRLNQEHQGRIVIAFSHGTFISALRTVIGDRRLISDAGFVAYRDRVLGHAEPHWLSQPDGRDEL